MSLTDAITVPVILKLFYSQASFPEKPREATGGFRITVYDGPVTSVCY
jgi:hypothetical protein